MSILGLRAHSNTPDLVAVQAFPLSTAKKKATAKIDKVRMLQTNEPCFWICFSLTPSITKLIQTTQLWKNKLLETSPGNYNVCLDFILHQRPCIKIKLGVWYLGPSSSLCAYVHASHAPHISIYIMPKTVCHHWKV